MVQDDARNSTWCLVGNPTAPGRPELSHVGEQLADAERDLQKAGAKKRISRKDQCASREELLDTLREAWTPREMVVVEDDVRFELDEGGSEALRKDDTITVDNATCHRCARP